jgi:uncharacterized protein YjdB
VIHGVFVNPATVTLLVGSSTTLAASVDAGPAVPNRGVIWSSGDSTVARVDQNGIVTAITLGATSVTAASIADPTISGTAKVLVGTSASSARR